MTIREDITNEAVVRALRCAGSVRGAARQLGVSTSLIYERAPRSPEIARALDSRGQPRNHAGSKKKRWSDHAAGN